MLEWDYLRVVLAVHRNGSMAAAADSLGVDRATIVRRLDSLETQLKSRLFERRPDGCVLTSAGRNIIGLVEGVEQAMTALQHRASGEDMAAEGSVRLAAPEFLITHVLAPAMGNFHTAFPSLEVALRTDFDSLDLMRGEAELALRFVRPANEAIVARRVGSVAVGLFASKTYLGQQGNPKAGNFNRHRLLLPEGQMASLPFMGWVLAQLTGVKVPLRCNEVAPLLAAAKQGLGIACLPVVAAIDEPSLQMIEPGVVGRGDIYLATHRDLRKRTRVRSVFDFVAKTCALRAGDLNGGEPGRVFKDDEL